MSSAPVPPASPTLILASASPRRRALLAQLGLPFTVLPAAIEERPYRTEEPRAYARRVAEAKARHLAQQYPEALVLGADTIVVLEARIFGKPGSIAEAQQMLTALSGRQHTVITALALLQQCRRFVRCASVSTLVRFRPLEREEIKTYVTTGEPLDKAGAYAIQGGAAAFVVSVQGCYTSVIGLPLQRTAALLREAGMHVPIVPPHNAQNAS